MVIPSAIGVIKLWNVVEGLNIKQEFKNVAFSAAFWVMSQVVSATMHAQPPEYHIDVRSILQWFGYHMVILSILAFPVYLSYTAKIAADVKTTNFGEVKRALSWHRRSRQKSRSKSRSDSGFTLAGLLHDPDLIDVQEDFREYLASICAIEAYLFYFAVCKFQEECSMSRDFPEYSVTDMIEDRARYGRQAQVHVGSIPGLNPAEAPATSAAESEHSVATNTRSSSVSKNAPQQLRDDLGLGWMNQPDEGMGASREALAAQNAATSINSRSAVAVSLASTTSNEQGATLLMICQWAVGMYCDFVLKSSKNSVRTG